MPNTNQNKETQGAHDEKKKALVEQLKKTPVVQIACEKVNLPRSTYYYLRKEDPDFAKAADEALAEGSQLVNDVAESQLLSAIKNGNMTAIIYWLKNHHKTYRERLELSGQIEQLNRDLTPEERAMIQKAIAIAIPQRKTKGPGAGEEAQKNNGGN